MLWIFIVCRLPHFAVLLPWLMAYTHEGGLIKAHSKQKKKNARSSCCCGGAESHCGFGMDQEASSPVAGGGSTQEASGQPRRIKDRGRASSTRAQLMAVRPEDVAGQQQSTSAVTETRPLSDIPRHSRPAGACIRASPEAESCRDLSPEVAAAVRQDPSQSSENQLSRLSQNTMKRRDRTPPLDFDFPSELPLPNISNLWLRDESPRATQLNSDGCPNRGTTIASSGSSSSPGAPCILRAKLHEHAPEIIPDDDDNKKRRQVHDGLAPNQEVDDTDVPAQAPSGTSPAPKQEDKFRNYKGALAASCQRRVINMRNRESPERRVHTLHTAFNSTRSFHYSPSHRMRHAMGHRTPVAPPLPAATTSSESQEELGPSRERRGALTPTRDQLQNLYNTLMILDHPPKRERLSRAAFRRKFFLPKGIKATPPQQAALPRHRLDSVTSIGTIKPADKGALQGGTDQGDDALSTVQCACLAACAVLAAVVTLTALYFFIAAPRNRPRQLVCSTDDCRLHALFLDYNINNTFSPCADLNSHICAAWKPSQTYAELGATALRHVAVNWVDNFLPLLRRGADPIKIAEKPLEMYEACAKDRDAATLLDATHFTTFMTELNLTWPGKSGVNALGLLVNLAFNWQMTFWLRFRVKISHKKHRKIYIVAGDADALSLFAMNHRYVMERGSYVDYWMTHYVALYNNTSVPPVSQITASASEQTDIITVLTDFRKKKRRLVTVVSPDSTLNLTGRITASDWLEKLTTHLPTGELFSFGDRVVGDGTLLDAIGLLFDKYSDEQLVYHLSWQFIQFYFLVLERRPLQIVHWGKAYSSAYVPVYCTLYVEEVYRPLVAAVHIKLTITPADTTRLNFALGGLMERLVSAINASQLEYEVKRSALTRFQSMQIQSWPPGRYFNEEESEKMYSCYPTNKDSFVQYWIESHRCLQRTTDFVFRRETTGLHRLLSSSPVAYDAILNEIAVGASALAHPLYYPHGTPAMFYGGLGFLFVAEALKALDSEALAIVSNASAALTNSTTEGKKASRCFTVQKNDTRATYFAALNIAYAAFVEDEATESLERRRPISDKHTEKTVFFLTVCRMMCRARTLQRPGSIDCNELFKNFPEFANAFSCPRESAMNPTERCFSF